jgi:hypothetical protein
VLLTSQRLTSLSLISPSRQTAEASMEDG